MNEVPRVTPEEIYPKLRSGEALLVCAYDNEAKSGGATGGRHLVGRVHVPPAYPAQRPGNRVLLRLTPGRLRRRSGL